MKRLPTLFEAVSTIVVMGIIVLIGFEFYNSLIQPLFILAAIYVGL